ncbi:MAG: TonB-dependent receptor [Bacteroidota bacterium]
MISAHKFGGPIGIGALLVRDYAMLEPIGGHERGYRQGTDTEQFRGILMTKFRPIQGLTIGVNTTVQLDSSGQTLYWQGYFPDTLQNINGEDSLITGGALTPTDDAGGFRKQYRTLIAVDPSIKYLSGDGSLFWYRGRFLRNANTTSTDQSSANQLYYNDFIYQRNLAENISWITGATYTHSVANGDSLFGGRHAMDQVGLYTQVDAKFGKFNAMAGYRYEWVKTDEDDPLTRGTMRVGLNYEIVKGTNVRASFGQGFRVPSLAERFAATSGGAIVVQPNPNIRAESGYSAEIGLRQAYLIDRGDTRMFGYVDVAAYRMRFEDMIEFGLGEVSIGSTPDGGLAASAQFASINVADAQITGLEITTLNEWRLGKKWRVSLSGGLNWLDPLNLNSVPAEQQLNLSSFPDSLLQILIDLGNPNLVDQPPTLKYRSRFTAKTSLSVGYSRFSLTANYRYRSEIEAIDQFLYLVVNDLGYFRRTHTSRQVMDLIGSYNINRFATLSLVVDNIWNEEYTIVPGFLAPQRKATMQLVLKF